jgi:hypothetical protein
VPSFLVETYLASGAPRDRRLHEGRARDAARELRQQGSSVVYVRAIHVPEDEICFFVFEAPSSREATLAAELAGLDTVRVVRAEVTAPNRIKKGDNA